MAFLPLPRLVCLTCCSCSAQSAPCLPAPSTDVPVDSPARCLPSVEAPATKLRCAVLASFASRCFSVSSSRVQCPGLALLRSCLPLPCGDCAPGDPTAVPGYASPLKLRRAGCSCCTPSCLLPVHLPMSSSLFKSLVLRTCLPLPCGEYAPEDPRAPGFTSPLRLRRAGCSCCTSSSLLHTCVAVSPSLSR